MKSTSRRLFAVITATFTCSGSTCNRRATDARLKIKESERVRSSEFGRREAGHQGPSAHGMIGDDDPTVGCL